VIVAAPFSQNPERLANDVYANRLGNGDESSGDGWRFRGAGLIQITGRQLYSELATAIVRDIDSLADWMQTPAGAAMSACWYWNLRHLNPIADGWDIQRITLLVNGGLTNLPTRTALSTAALHAFEGATVPAGGFQDDPAAETEADALNDRVLAGEQFTPTQE
jgi:putative chitinase